MSFFPWVPTRHCCTACPWECIQHSHFLELLHVHQGRQHDSNMAVSQKTAATQTRRKGLGHCIHSFFHSKYSSTNTYREHHLLSSYCLLWEWMTHEEIKNCLPPIQLFMKNKTKSRPMFASARYVCLIKIWCMNYKVAFNSQVQVWEDTCYRHVKSRNMAWKYDSYHGNCSSSGICTTETVLVS